MGKMIFIDRDGVINRDPGGWTDHGYVTRWKDFHFLPGAIEAIKRLNDAGYEIAVISNQAGVSKGYFSMDALNEITRLMLQEIEKVGAKVRSVHYCPHASLDNCDCRKPKAGLFEMATEGIDIDFSNTYFIGDGVMDVEAGWDLGLKTVIVLSGKTRLEDVEAWRIKPDFIKMDLVEAVEFVLSREGK